MRSDKAGMHNLFDRVLLIRHGETEWNVTGRRQGQLDSPLTAKGEAQATANASRLTRVTGIYTSPLGRARQTANLLAKATGLPVTVVADLTELDHGTFAGRQNTEISTHPPRMADKYGWRFPEGESYADVDLRAATVLKTIAELTRSPALVTHEMIGRMLLRNLLAMTPAEALAMKHPQDVIYVVENGTLTRI